ncbi:MAG TPA: arginine deiminase-related protein [Terriglobales bacterium]|nr:arginine deiminase-related protein [Terriglobales bacterium]
MAKKVLLCPPTYFEVREVKNPYMRGLLSVDPVRAQNQWEAVCEAFRAAGFAVELIDPVPDLEDMVFAANPVFVGSHPQHGRFVVPGRMRYVSRRPEVAHYVEWFRGLGYKVVDLDLGEDFLEGHGDLIWDADGSRIWAGYGFRSNRAGVEKFAAAMRGMEIPVVPLQLVDEHFYHLDACFAPLGAGAALIYPGAFSADALQLIRERIARIYEVNRDDALQFVCNGVAANGKFLTPAITHCVEEALAREGLEPVLLDTSEFLKSGGSVCCLKLFFD